jgi:protein-S-isoprenylcysteine O-methyltransferase Ste14
MTKKPMDIIGKSPIAVPVLILGKIAMLGCWLFFVVKKLSADAMLYDSAVTQALGVAVSVAGLILVILSLLHLGRSASVGIPEQKTELKTHGMYRISRNPVYVGGFLMCAGSCLFSIHFLNFLLFAITIAVHHLIVRKEEQFLEKAFGQQWLDYKERVPRYVGRIRSISTVRNSA